MSKIKYIQYVAGGVALSLAGAFIYYAYQEKVAFQSETADLCERIAMAKTELPKALEEIAKKYDLKGDFKYWVDYHEVESELPEPGLITIKLNCGSDVRELKQSR